MLSAAFAHSFCMMTRMPKPSLAMISADSGLTGEAWKRRSGCESGRGRIAVRGIWKNSPRHSNSGSASAVLISCAASTKRGRASSIGMRNPAYSTLAAQNVEQRDLLGNPDRVMPRQHNDRGAEQQPPRASGKIGQQLDRRRRHRVAGEVMLERP